MKKTVETHVIGDMVCPHCGRVVDRSTGESGGPPDIGALSVCSKCAGVSQFVADGLLLKMVPFDVNQLDAETMDKVELLQKLVWKMNPKGGGK